LPFTTQVAPASFHSVANEAQFRLRHGAGNAAQRDLCDPPARRRYDEPEAAEIAALMRDKLLRRGETATDVVVVQGGSKETLRLHGDSYSVARMRAAMFNAAITWQPIELD